MRNTTHVSILSLVLALGVAPAFGATYIVDRFSDDGMNGLCDPVDCSLREAIISANGNPGTDIIELGPGTYELEIPPFDPGEANGDLDITDSVVISGIAPEQTIIDANQLDRVLEVAAFITGVTIKNVTITGGWLPGEEAGSGLLINEGSEVIIDNCIVTHNTGDSGGGGIRHAGSRLEVLDSTLSYNSQGGIHACCSSSSVLIVENSTMVGNEAADGYAIWTAVNTSINNTTISGNTALAAGGAVVAPSGYTTITNSTIFDNGSYTEQGLWGNISVANSIIQGCSHTVVTSLGGNVESPDDTCQLDEVGDQVNVELVDLALGALADNGGPTQTRALVSGSVAKDTALPGYCPATDQRGFPRSAGAGCDVGAFELQSQVFADGLETGDTTRWSLTIP